MNEPIYKPEQWIIYQQGESAGFGQIVGGSYDGEMWNYSIKGSLLDTTFALARQNEIIRYYENGSWLEPRSGGIGNGSAYTTSA
jgi:hypothetical protein